MKPITTKNVCSARSASARRAAALALSAVLLAGGAAWAERANSLSGNTLIGEGGAAWSADQIVPEEKLTEQIRDNVTSNDNGNVSGGALWAFGGDTQEQKPGHITLSGEDVVVQSNRAVSTSGSAFGGAMCSRRHHADGRLDHRAEQRRDRRRRCVGRRFASQCGDDL